MKNMTFSGDSVTLTPQSDLVYGTPQTAVQVITLQPGQHYTASGELAPSAAQEGVVMSGQIDSCEGRMRAGQYGAYQRFPSGQPLALQNPSPKMPATLLLVSRYSHSHTSNRQSAARPVTEERPWGHFTVLADAPDYKLKELVIKPGGCLSLQRHEKRAEHWFVLQGAPTVLKGRTTQQLQPGDYIRIPRHAWHRIDNRAGTQDVVIIELQKGAYFGEDDIERKQDVYGRK